MKLLLISHGDFAAGIASTLRTFFGADNVYSACVTQERGTADLMDKAQAYLEEWGEEQVVICSDLKGGSANQAALALLARPGTYLISGMNLALLLQLVMESEITEDGIREMIAAAKEDMAFINEMALGDMDEDDE